MTAAPLGPPGSAERLASVARWFAPVPEPREATFAHALLGTAVIAMLAAFSLLAAGLRPAACLMGGVACATGLQGALRLREHRSRRRRALPKPADAAIDATLHADLARLTAAAPRHLGVELDEGAQPLVVFGPRGRGRCGTDGQWRFSAHHVLVFCPARHHLAVLAATIPLGSGTPREQSTCEYRYGDVLGVLVAIHTGTFAIEFAGGERCSLVVGEACDVEAAVGALRRVLRAKQVAVRRTEVSVQR